MCPVGIFERLHDGILTAGDHQTSERLENSVWEISMVKCKTAVSPVPWQRRYCSLAQNHRYSVVFTSLNIACIMQLGKILSKSYASIYGPIPQEQYTLTMVNHHSVSMSMVVSCKYIYPHACIYHYRSAIIVMSYNIYKSRSYQLCSNVTCYAENMFWRKLNMQFDVH